MGVVLGGWVAAALRVGLLVTLVAAVHGSVADDALAAACLLAAWAPVLLHLFERSDGGLRFEEEQAVVLAAAARSVAVLEGAGDADGDWVWTLPLALAPLAVLVSHRPKDGNGGARLFYLPRPALLRLAVGGAGIWLALADLSAWRGVEVAAALLLLWGVDSARGEGPAAPAVLAWTWLQLTALPLDADPLPRATGLLIVWLVSTALRAGTAPPGAGPCERLAGTVADLAQGALEATAAVLLRPVLWQVVVLLATGATLVLARQPWYTTTGTFPDDLRAVCSVPDAAIEAARLVFRFTRDDDFQAKLMPVMPEVAAARVSLHGRIAKVNRLVRICRDGVRTTYAPTSDLFAVLALAAMAAVALGAALPLLPGRAGARIARSAGFWSVGAVVATACLLLAHLAGDLSVTLWDGLLGASRTRVYTEAGQYALLTTAAVAVACGALAALARAGVGTPRRGYAAVASVGGAGEAPGPARRPWLDYLLQPAVVLLAAAVLVFLFTLAAVPNPVKRAALVSFHLDGVRLDADFALTPVDYGLTLAASSLRALLARTGGRIAFIAAALVLYALEKVGCWGCLCLPIKVPNFGDALDDIGDAFGSIGFRRRRRRLLADTCPADDSCSKTRICVSDVVSNIVEEITGIATKGLEYAADAAAGLLVARVPFLDRLDDQLERLQGVIDLGDFRLIGRGAGADLDLDLGLDIHLPSLAAPLFRPPGVSLPAPSVGLGALLLAGGVLLLLLVAAKRAGALRQAARAALHSAELGALAAVAGALLVLAVGLFGVRDQLRANGYDLAVTFHTGAYGYAVALALAVLAAFAAFVDAGDE